MSLRGFMDMAFLQSRAPSVHRRESDESVKSVDIASALQSPPARAEVEELDYAMDTAYPVPDVPLESDIVPSPSTASSHTRSSRSPTRSFAGVARSALPANMTDEVDVDLRLTYTPIRPRFRPLAPIMDDTDASDSYGIPHDIRSPRVAEPHGMQPMFRPFPSTTRQSSTASPLRSTLELTSPDTPSSSRSKKSDDDDESSDDFTPHQLRFTFQQPQPVETNEGADITSAHHGLHLSVSPNTACFSPASLSSAASRSTPGSALPPPSAMSDAFPMQPLNTATASSSSHLPAPVSPRTKPKARPMSVLHRQVPLAERPKMRRPLSYVPFASARSAAPGTPSPPPVSRPPHMPRQIHQDGPPRVVQIAAIPTAPLPSRLLARRRQRAAEMAAMERARRHDEDGEAERQLKELEIQL